MHEGKIIKYYREKAGLTQSQLGEGICSDTHISKIERGLTDYSPEITRLLSQRLGIDIPQELCRAIQIKQRLLRWQETIVMHQMNEMDEIHHELKHMTLLRISDYKMMYQLLLARYELMRNNPDSAYRIMKELQKLQSTLPPYENNLLKHVWGLYYLSKQDYVQAISTLNQITELDYPNPEYFYHLAVAYHMVQSQIMCYYYAEKSLKYFKEMNYFLRGIDAEMLMLIQLKDEENLEFRDSIERFHNLLQSCDMCHAPDRKAKVLHNLAYEYYRRKEYESASRYYQQSMELKNKLTGPYLLSLEGYIRSSLEGNLIPREDLSPLISDGLSIATKLKESLYIVLFNLLKHFIQDEEEAYHEYLQHKALPMYRQQGYTYLVIRSEKELFSYYVNRNQLAQALEIAACLITPK
ncbi:helix-turn-helix domain-containing protein [Paenibacillus gansuensis]|uniref:Helix-turn-helix domain-containing protein n=1 Tax=Paenibacillus gansuensis TaxID=306542 RepID=A0ABW5PD91_9BACL